MDDQSFITLHRKIINSACFADAELLKVWLWCLVRANYRDREVLHGGQVITLKRGDFITGRIKAVEELHMTAMKFRSRIATLVLLKQITQKTTNRFTVYSVVKYDDYQSKPEKLTNKYPTNNQQITTDNNINNINNSSDATAPPINMGNWNTKGDDYEEGIVDSETGVLVDPLQEKKSQTKELTSRKKELIDWLIQVQQRDPLRTNRPNQMKALNRLIEMKVTGQEAQQMVLEQMQSDYWRERKEKPDFATVVAIIQKQGV